MRSPSTHPPAGWCADSVNVDSGPDESFRVAALRTEDARARAFSSPLVGRAQQLHALSDELRRGGGRPRAATSSPFSGAAGVGKSRLVDELVDEPG